MSTAPSALVSDLASRRVPKAGGFNLTALQLEIRRMLRNRRTLIITLIFPVFFFLIFGLNKAYALVRIGHGNYAAFIMISIALYGAVAASMFGGAMVSIERAQGWSRQLRLTPLSSGAYIGMKVVSALVLALGPVVILTVVGLATHRASMPGYLWIVSPLCVWVASPLFAVFGLFVGYLLPPENVIQLLGLILTLLAFAGGLFVPLSLLPGGVQAVAQWTPEVGLNQLVHAPLLGQGVDWTWVVNVIAWLAIFAGGAMWRFGKDTARV
jgi:ABC-2 type transport system permease protein